MIDLFYTPYSRKRLQPTEFEKQLADMLLGSVSSNSVSFPKYNIYQLMDGNPYITFMEFALAGYNKSDLSIKADNGYLYLSGKADESSKDRNYLHRGMARRSFDVKFSIGRDTEVRKAEFTDGLLVIELEKIVPEDKKPKEISIF